MSAPRKNQTAFRPTLDGTLEDRIAAANVGGVRAAMMSAFFAQRQAAFAARAEARAFRPAFRAPLLTANRMPTVTTSAYRPDGPAYYIVNGPTDTPLGQWDNVAVLH